MTDNDFNNTDTARLVAEFRDVTTQLRSEIGRIIVGQEIPYLSSTESGTANPVNTYEFKEVAVRMEVTPHVSEDGRIFLDVHPQVKSLIGYQGDPPQPVLSTRGLL